MCVHVNGEKCRRSISRIIELRDPAWFDCSMLSRQIAMCVQLQCCPSHQAISSFELGSHTCILIHRQSALAQRISPDDWFQACHDMLWASAFILWCIGRAIRVIRVGSRTCMHLVIDVAIHSGCRCKHGHTLTWTWSWTCVSCRAIWPCPCIWIMYTWFKLYRFALLKPVHSFVQQSSCNFGSIWYQMPPRKDTAKQRLLADARGVHVPSLKPASEPSEKRATVSASAGVTESSSSKGKNVRKLSCQMIHLQIPMLSVRKSPNCIWQINCLQSGRLNW